MSRSLIDRRAGVRVSVVEGVNLVLGFRRKADAQEAVTPQAAHGVAHLADLAHARVRVAVLDVDERRGFRALRRVRSEEHTSELQSRQYLVCRLLLEKKR